MKKLIRILAVVGLAFGLGGSLPGLVATPAQASIYDTDLGKLKLSAGQRSKVSAVVGQSRSQRGKVFAKHGIRASAKPDMDKLMKAANELQAISRAERAKLARILTPTQLRQYDRLVREVEDRVRRAAN